LKKKKKFPERFKNKVDRHHTIPQSRGGKDSDIVEWDVMFHRKWHELFQNMTVEEIHQFIDIICQPNKVFDSRDIARLRGRIKKRNEAH